MTGEAGQRGQLGGRGRGPLAGRRRRCASGCSEASSRAERRACATPVSVSSMSVVPWKRPLQIPGGLAVPPQDDPAAAAGLCAPSARGVTGSPIGVASSSACSSACSSPLPRVARRPRAAAARGSPSTAAPGRRRPAPRCAGRGRRCRRSRAGSSGRPGRPHGAPAWRRAPWEPLLDLVDDRLDLPVVGRGGQQEGVGDRQHVADVVGDDVVREPVGGRLGGGRG